MNILLGILLFLFGTIIGSFLNVVIYRLGTSRKIVNSRSVCFSCSKKLYWYELIPIFSFMIQKGRCRGCASRISHQYPAVELLTGLVFLILAYHFLPVFSPAIYIWQLVYFMFLFSLLIVISFYDLRHKIIPDHLVYTFIFFSFLLSFLDFSGFSLQFVWPDIWQIFAGPLLALPFFIIWLMSHGRLMGFGDIKLMLGIGWMLGIYSAIASLMIAFWLGAIVGIYLLIIAKYKVSMKTEVPFAPFLVLGAFIAFIYEISLFDLPFLFLS